MRKIEQKEMESMADWEACGWGAVFLDDFSCVENHACPWLVHAPSHATDHPTDNSQTSDNLRQVLSNGR